MGNPPITKVVVHVILRYLQIHCILLRHAYILGMCLHAHTVVTTGDVVKFFIYILYIIIDIHNKIMSAYIGHDQVAEVTCVEGKLDS